MKTYELTHGASRPDWKGTKTFRELTETELLNLRSGETVFSLAAVPENYRTDVPGKAVRCRVNGKPQTWKTRRDIRVPCKYGLRETYQVWAFPQNCDDGVQTCIYEDIVLLREVEAATPHELTGRFVGDGSQYTITHPAIEEDDPLADNHWAIMEG